MKPVSSKREKRKQLKNTVRRMESINRRSLVIEMDIWEIVDIRKGSSFGVFRPQKENNEERSKISAILRPLETTPDELKKNSKASLAIDEKEQHRISRSRKMNLVLSKPLPIILLGSSGGILIWLLHHHLISVGQYFWKQPRWMTPNYLTFLK